MKEPISPGIAINSLKPHLKFLIPKRKHSLFKIFPSVNTIETKRLFYKCLSFVMRYRKKMDDCYNSLIELRKKVSSHLLNKTSLRAKYPRVLAFQKTGFNKIQTAIIKENNLTFFTYFVRIFPEVNLHPS